MEILIAFAGKDSAAGKSMGVGGAFFINVVWASAGMHRFCLWACLSGKVNKLRACDKELMVVSLEITAFAAGIAVVWAYL